MGGEESVLGCEDVLVCLRRAERAREFCLLGARKFTENFCACGREK